MRRHHHHHDRDLELAAKLFGLFMLIAGILWLITVTYGAILVPVIAALWLYRRKTGRWPGRKQQGTP
jgi:hypothetical protein